MMDAWLRDFKHAARGLARTPAFTLIVIATLALPIGANTAIFSVADAVLLRPLPFPDADRLVHIGGTAPGCSAPSASCSSLPARTSPICSPCAPRTGVRTSWSGERSVRAAAI